MGNGVLWSFMWGAERQVQVMLIAAGHLSGRAQGREHEQCY